MSKQNLTEPKTETKFVSDFRPFSSWSKCQCLHALRNWAQVYEYLNMAAIVNGVLEILPHSL